MVVFYGLSEKGGWFLTKKRRFIQHDFMLQQKDNQRILRLF
jgi:hypothetical protein